MKYSISKKKWLVGVVRLLPLMGYPKFSGLNKVVKTALSDIHKLEVAGFQGALIDNDAHPHVIRSSPEMVASFAIIMKELISKSKIPLGVQFLLDDPEAALAIAKVSGAVFIRTDFFVDKVKTNYGVMIPRAKQIVQLRKLIHAQKVKIFADVQVKYSQLLESKTLEKSVSQAIIAKADGIIITGSKSGVAPVFSNLVKAKLVAKDVPIIIGSGLNSNNLHELMKVANGAFVGTAIRNHSRIDFKKANFLYSLFKEFV
jgi:membrane complex biogenesis BtpA family protein